MVTAADIHQEACMEKISKSAGLYLHIPFCKKKCPYCDFYSITDLSLIQPFVRALKKEMELSGNTTLHFDTIYIGGGTPSVLGPEEIFLLIDTARGQFDFLPDVEITLEINPGTVNMSGLKAYRDAGINRISIGVQSFETLNLEFLGRIHSERDAALAVNWARDAGFDNIGLDLIYGIPGQSPEAWIQDLKRAVEFEPEHFSCYMLTYEPGTPMEKKRQQCFFQPMSDRVEATLFETANDFLTTRGYEHYEISNFAKTELPSARSRHNQKYWSYSPYIGLGPSAHSFIEPERRWNCRSVKQYVDRIDSGKRPVEGNEVLTRQQQMMEWIYLGLRTGEGIHMNRFNKKFDVDFRSIYKGVITDLTEKGYIKTEKNRCCLTRQGMLFLDSIASMLIHQHTENISHR